MSLSNLRDYYGGQKGGPAANHGMRLSLSPSSIGLFIDCPRCFWLEAVRGIKRPSSGFPTLPLGVDKVLKEHFDLHRRDGTMPGELGNAWPGIRLFPDMEKLKVWRDNRKGLRFTDPETGITLMGALDDLLITGEGLHAPLDFKTRGYPRKENTHERYQHQMDIYTLLLEKNSMPTADYAVLLFYHPKTVTKSCHIEFEADALKLQTSQKNGQRLFWAATHCLLSESEPEPKKTCEWCGWDR